MKEAVTVRITRRHYDILHGHLFPGGYGEHGAIVLAGLAKIGQELRLTVRDVVLAKDGKEYVIGESGYHSLKATAISPLIKRCRDERLVYLAVHNHLSDDAVEFSDVDLNSHSEGYPALLDIARGMPVGALVFGRRSVQADLWLPDRSRRDLREMLVIGQSVHRLYPRQPRWSANTDKSHDRQVRMFGAKGQQILRRMRIAVVGLGGIGSLVTEYLARLGIGEFILVDEDVVETSNLSRLVGANQNDADNRELKVDVAERHIREANAHARITKLAMDAAAPKVVEELKSADYIFLAADTMRARLVINGLAQQYFIPAVQLGAKVTASHSSRTLEDAISIVRPMRPGDGCLFCNGLIDSTALATELLKEEERRDIAYGVQEPNPSVITLNAVSAAHAVNDFLFDFLELRDKAEVEFLHLSHIRRRNSAVSPTHSPRCTECSCSLPHSRFARGDAVSAISMAAFSSEQDSHIR